MGHLHPEAVAKLCDGPVSGVTCKVPAVRSAYGAEGKQQRRRFPASEAETKARLELVHSDVCEPVSVHSIGGNRYFIAFIDDFTWMTVADPMKFEAEISEKLKAHVALAERFSGVKLKLLHTDNESE